MFLLTRCATRYAGVVAVFIMMVLNGLETQIIATAIEWLLYVTVPNYCLYAALTILPKKHEHASLCNEIYKYANQEVFCEQMSQNNQTHQCCPGKLQMSFCQIYTVLLIFSHCLNPHNTYFHKQSRQFQITLRGGMRKGLLYIELFPVSILTLSVISACIR